MARVLVTGMSGTVKSRLLAALARRGHLTVDTDYEGWVSTDGTWDEARMAALLAGATVELDATTDPESLVDEVESLLGLRPPTRP